MQRKGCCLDRTSTKPTSAAPRTACSERCDEPASRPDRAAECHAADAVVAAEAGADAIGLNFVSRSRRCLDVKAARVIRAVVPDRVVTVGIFWDHPASEIIEIAKAVGLGAAQLHGDTPGVAAAVATVVQTVIQVVKIEGPAVGPFDGNADTILMLDGPVPGSGVPIDWDVASDLTTDRKILLAGGLRPGNVAEAVRRVRPWGVDVASGVESGSGQKDPVAVARFVVEARAAAKQAGDRGC